MRIHQKAIALVCIGFVAGIVASQAAGLLLDMRGSHGLTLHDRIFLAGMTKYQIMMLEVKSYAQVPGMAASINETVRHFGFTSSELQTTPEELFRVGIVTKDMLHQPR